MEKQIVLSMGSILSIIASFGVMFAWFYKLISKNFDNLDKKLDKMDTEIKGVRSEMQDQGSQLRGDLNQIRNEVQEQNSQIRNDFNQLRNEIHQGLANMQNYFLLGRIDQKLTMPTEEKEKKKNQT